MDPPLPGVNGVCHRAMALASVILLPWAAVGLFYLVFMGLAHWHMSAHGAALDDFERVMAGMTQAEVEAILGQPTSEGTTSRGTNGWAYTRWTWCMVTITFSEDGTVIESVHDH